MNIYALSALIAMVLFGMGLGAVILALLNFIQNIGSQKGRQMLYVCICVFFWDFGYAWMSLCYESDIAYIARAIALLAVTFYMFFILRYVSLVTGYPRKKLNVFLLLFTIASLGAWTQIIQKSAVSFQMTPWGYWYTSQMTAARLIQFGSIIAALIQYYVILNYGKKHTEQKRELHVLIRFGWFGVILFAGYMLDTLLPVIFHIPAVPGSSIGAFFSAMILFHISRTNKTFGLSKANVSEYVFRDVSIPVIITDNKGKIMLQNDYTMKYLQCEEKDLLQHEMSDFFHEMPEQGLFEVGDSGCVAQFAKTDVRDQFEDMLYSIYFVQDVTKERQSRKMLEESRAEAEEASRAKSNFLANMSHEIRTPMNAIIGMSDIVLRDKEIAEHTRSQVREINVAGTNLLGIINDILDISKIEAGKYELIPEEYILPSLLNDVANIIQVRVQESNSEFVLEADPTLPKNMIGDVVRIRQIVLNILGNAAKFTKNGTITLRVSWNQNKSAPRIRFDVADTGIGIKPEDIDSIFGAFNQVDTRKNRSIQGTGLGLAISKHLAELMQGTITVESVYGEGSTFHIEIAQEIKEYKEVGQVIIEAIQNHEYSNEVTEQQLDIIPRPDKKLLIVDDIKVNLMVAKAVMERYELQIDTAKSGKKALEMVQNKEYDLIFMDHMMPGMDGIDTTKLIRVMGGHNAEVPIVALTANVVGDAKQMFLDAGMQDFLGKPIELRDVDEVMNRWLPV